MSKSLSLHRTNWMPSCSVTLPHCDHNLTLTPFSLCVICYHTSEAPGFVIQKTLLRSRRLHISSSLIKSKRPLTKLPPCHCTEVSRLVNPCPCDVRLTPVCFIPPEGRGYKTAASHVKDLATLQTQ